MCGKWLAGVVVTVQLVCLAPTLAADDWVRVVPKESDEILANPGMGWETFHRTSKQDKSLPSWIPFPGDLAPGDYTLSIAMVGEKSEEPVVRLGIKGRGDDGWYPVSKVSVTR